MLPSTLRPLLFAFLSCYLCTAHASPLQAPLLNPSLSSLNTDVTQELLNDLEELSRIVDISYCVGTTGLGITKPFECASRCSDPGFEGFELVTTWNTGALLSDSCGYMVLSHPPSQPRIILAFRGTYSVANTVIDLSTVPQEYIPYPGDEDGDSEDESRPGLKKRDINPLKAECTNCTVHAGFMKAWRETRPPSTIEGPGAKISWIPSYTRRTLTRWRNCCAGVVRFPFARLGSTGYDFWGTAGWKPGIDEVY